jgi:predicted protein tyrosine phosphatase
MREKKTLSQLIMETDCPWDNQYQGKDKKVLFVCSVGILRSATGARMYAQKYNTRAAGSEHYALIPVTGDLLIWADEIIFVNKENYKSVADVFDMTEIDPKVKILNIPDQYPYMDVELQKHFKEQYEPL